MLTPLGHRASRRIAVRSIALASLGVCVALSGALAPACADEAAHIPNANAIERPPRTIGPAVADPAPDAAPEDAPTIDVGGRVVDEREVPIIGRPIVVIDRRGKRQEVLTDEEGGFYALGMVPPYDVAVAQAPFGSVISPVLYLGLTRRDPRLEVFESQGPQTLPQSQTLRVAVRLPSCRVATGACWVRIASASPSGGGATAASFTHGDASVVYDVEHSWSSTTTRPGETIDLHVLVGDADCTQYAYAHVSHVAVHPGELTDLGGTAPSPVESSEPVTVIGRAQDLPEGWEWTLASQIELAGGAAIALRYDLSAKSTMRLPLLPAATWHVGAWTQHAASPERPYFHRSSQSWTGALALTTTNVSLDLPIAPNPIRPAMEEGTLPRRGVGLAWDAKAQAVASLVLVDLGRGRQVFRAFTTEGEISLKRLEALGVRRLEPGDHVFDLTTTPNANVDQLTHPDAPKRKNRFDLHVPGATTYQRFRFEVTR